MDPDVESSDMVLDFKLSLDEDMQGGGYIKEHYVKREMQQKVLHSLQSSQGSGCLDDRTT